MSNIQRDTPTVDFETSNPGKLTYVFVEQSLSSRLSRCVTPELCAFLHPQACASDYRCGTLKRDIEIVFLFRWVVVGGRQSSGYADR